MIHFQRPVLSSYSRSSYSRLMYTLCVFLDIDECEHPKAYSCYGTCQNFPGSFQCQCPNGTYGNPTTRGRCITIKNSLAGTNELCLLVTLFVVLQFSHFFHVHLATRIRALMWYCRNLFPLEYVCLLQSKEYNLSLLFFFSGLSIGLGVGGDTILLLLGLGGPFLVRKFRLQKIKKMKQRFFNQNHGLLLQ